MEPSAKEKIIVAADVGNLDAAGELFGKLENRVGWVKIGLELFVAAGPDVIRAAKDHGFQIFLDLKFHDIPNTMRGAVRSALRWEVGMATVHALAGPEALRVAAEEARESKTKLLAVTVLTSMDATQTTAVGLSGSPEQNVLSLARIALENGVPGLVASPMEAPRLREHFGREFCLVTPGIRPANSEVGDQKRITTPADAIRMGSDYLVIGRPITHASDPAAAADAIARGITESSGG